MEHSTYLVDNAALCSQTDGVIYRFSKDLADFDESRLAEWGSTVCGRDEGDGWLSVGVHYLPTTIRGVQILSRVEDGPEAVVASGSPALAASESRYDIECCYEVLDLISGAAARRPGGAPALEVFSLDDSDDEALEQEGLSEETGGAACSRSESPGLLLQYEWLSMHRVEACFSAGESSHPTSPRPASPRLFVDEAAAACDPAARGTPRPRSPSPGASDRSGSTRAPDSPGDANAWAGDAADRCAPAFPLRAGLAHPLPPGAGSALRHALADEAWSEGAALDLWEGLTA